MTNGNENGDKFLMTIFVTKIYVGLSQKIKQIKVIRKYK